MRVLGPNAHKNLREIARIVQSMARGNKAAEKRFNQITTHGRFMDFESGTTSHMGRWWSEISGHNAIPVEGTLATVGAAIRTLQNVTKLGRATLASVVDLATATADFRHQGGGFFDSYAKTFTGIFEGTGSAAYRREVWEALNIGTTVMNDMSVSRGISDDTPIGLTGRINNGYFKLNMLAPYTDRVKRAVATSNARFMGIQAQKGWDQLDPHFQGVMQTYGIGEAEWNIFNRIQFQDTPDGKAYLSIDSLDLLDDGAFPMGADIPAMREDLERKLRIYHTDQADSAVVTPDAESRAFTTWGQPQGTWTGEFMRFFFQFKAFPTAIHKRVVRRHIFGRGTEHQTYAGVARAAILGKGNGEMLAMSELIAAATIMGYAAIGLKDLSEGKTPRRPTDAKGQFTLLLDSMLQGGAAGLHADILIGDMLREDPFKRGGLETVGGPGISFLLKDVIGGASTVTYGMLWGDDGDKIATRLWKSMRSNVPMQNTFWLKWATDYMVMHKFGEWMHPGYLDYLEDAADKKGQEYMVPLPGR
jgi:hypothetical protein